MQVYNTSGAKFNAILFIQLYGMARKLAPPRFMTLRLHSDRYADIVRLAAPPESIQLGDTPGPLGRQITRVACIKPPMGVADGIAIVIDDKFDPMKLQFEIHGEPELIVTGFSV